MYIRHMMFNVSVLINVRENTHTHTHTDTHKFKMKYFTSAMILDLIFYFVSAYIYH